MWIWLVDFSIEYCISCSKFCVVWINLVLLLLMHWIGSSKVWETLIVIVEVVFYPIFSSFPNCETLATNADVINGINPFVPSIPKNGTPNLTAFIKIIQALMGYTTDDAYVALNKLLAAMNLLRYLLRYEWLILDKSWILWILSSLTYYGKYIIQPKRSKIALSWPPSPPRTPALHRSFGAIDTFGPWGLGPTKSTAFLGHRSPGHERASIELDRTSPVLFTT